MKSMSGSMIRVGILEDDAAFRKTLQEAFARYSSGIGIVWERSAGDIREETEICDRVSSLRINALLLSESVPCLVPAVARIRGNPLLHTVIAVIAGEEPEQGDCACGADFILKKSFNLFTVSRRICSLCAGTEEAWERDRERMLQAAREILVGSGFDPALGGTEYLARAAVAAAYDRAYLHSFSALYYSVGLSCGTSAASVEKSIRGAIRKAGGKAPGRGPETGSRPDAPREEEKRTASRYIAELRSAVMQSVLQPVLHGDQVKQSEK